MTMISQTDKKVSTLHLRVTTTKWVQDFRNLTRAQLGVLYYINTLDPFGDRGVQVTITEMAQELGLDKSSVSRALKQLDQEQYIDLELVKAQVRVLHPRNGVAPTQQAMHPRNLRCTHATDDAPAQQRMHPRNNQEPEPLHRKDFNSPHTIQTIQTTHTLSDNGSSEKKTALELNNAQPCQQQPAESLQNAHPRENHSLVKIKDSVQDKSSAAPLYKNLQQRAFDQEGHGDTETRRHGDVESSSQDTNNLRSPDTGTHRHGESGSFLAVHEQSPRRRVPHSPRQLLRSFDWLPDGPWMVDGKLDPNFRDAIARDWINRYGGDIHQRRADVLAHFKKDPANLAIRWEQYSSEYLHRYQNTQQVLASGGTVDQEYQQRLVQNHRAITEQLPSEVDPIARELSTPGLQELTHTSPVLSEGESLPEIVSTAVVAPAIDAHNTSQTSIPTDEQGMVLNPDAYQVYSPGQDEDQLASPEQFQQMLRSFSSGLSMPSPQKQSQPETDVLAELNAWLADPILRAEVMPRVMNSDRYTVEFDDYGEPLRVVEVQS